MRREQENSGKGYEERGKLYFYVLAKEGMFLLEEEKWQVDSVAEILVDFPKASRP